MNSSVLNFEPFNDDENVNNVYFKIMRYNAGIFYFDEPADPIFLKEMYRDGRGSVCPQDCRTSNNEDSECESITYRWPTTTTTVTTPTASSSADSPGSIVALNPCFAKCTTASIDTAGHSANLSACEFKNIDLLDLDSYAILTQLATLNREQKATVFDVSSAISHLWYAIYVREKQRIRMNIPVDTMGYEHYINKPFISEFICLVQQQLQCTEVQLCSTIHRRLGQFLSKLGNKFPNLLLNILYQQAEMTMNKSRYPVSILEDVFEFHIDSPVCHSEIVNIVNVLYPNSNVIELFKLIGATQKTIYEQLATMYGEHNMEGNKLRSLFARMAQHDSRAFSQVIDALLIVVLSFNRQSTFPDTDLNSKLLIFCYYSTIYEYICNQKRANPWDVLGQTNQLELVHYAPFNLASEFCLTELYRLALNLTLFAGIFDHHQSLYELLRLQVNDLHFGQLIQKNNIIFQAGLSVFHFNMEHLRTFDVIPSAEIRQFRRDHLPELPEEETSRTVERFDLNNNSRRRRRRSDSLMNLPRMSNLDFFEAVQSAGVKLESPLNNSWQFAECNICAESQWLLVRNCCSIPVCLECLGRYYTSQVQNGAVAIECISTRCKQLVFREEIFERLNRYFKDVYFLRLLAHSSASEHTKPCPRCNRLLCREFDPQLIKLTGESNHRSKKRINSALKSIFCITASSDDSIKFKVECEECKLSWCFRCHSPWHDGLTCESYSKGDKQFREWAQDTDLSGQVNAQQCPQCRVFIQRSSGCDHMFCTRCNTNFCYKCGDKLRRLRFFGDHYSKLSVLGCKYSFKPNKPLQRKLIRGSVLGGKLVALPVLTTVGLCVGAVVLAVGVTALPLFGGIHVYRRLKHSNRPVSSGHGWKWGLWSKEEQPPIYRPNQTTLNRSSTTDLPDIITNQYTITTSETIDEEMAYDVHYCDYVDAYAIVNSDHTSNIKT